MTQRERMLAVYRGETPDCVPFFLDLSRWFNERHKIPFDLSAPPAEPDFPLIQYHRDNGARFYIANLLSSYDIVHPDVVSPVSKHTSERGLELVWRIATPLGTIERRRLWEEQSYSWSISQWGVRTEQDLRVFEYAMTRARFVPAFDRWTKWQEAVGQGGSGLLEKFGRY